MYSVNTLSLTSSASDWLASSHHPRVLHIFDSVCNLINERREVLSIVTPQIGNGPFNLVIEGDVCFTEHLNLQSPVFISFNQLTLGVLTIHIANAKLWNPYPAWEILHIKTDDIFKQLRKLRITNYLISGGLDTPFAKTAQDCSTTAIVQSLLSSLSSAIANADVSSALKVTSQLAGLGIGLTPAGDDVLMGAIYAAWIIHPLEVAGTLAQEIANNAAPLTTSLSAAWLRSAGKGEAGILWHQFFEALMCMDARLVQYAVDQIFSVGETSGADAMTGFFSTMMAWAELSYPNAY